jgi:uncharacterized protein YaeQ
MALSSTLYRFLIDFSDVDQNVYKTLDLRLAQHPSESHAYLLTRLIARVLNDREYLEFSAGGLSDPDSPALHATTPGGDILLWVEIGNAAARKLHKASKAARKVMIYTYKDPKPMLEEIRENKVHRAETLDITSFDARPLENLAARLDRKNQWAMLVNEGLLSISIGDYAETVELRRHTIEKA